MCAIEFAQVQASWRKLRRKPGREQADRVCLHAKMAAERTEHLSEVRALRRKLEQARAQNGKQAGKMTPRALRFSKNGVF